MHYTSLTQATRISKYIDTDDSTRFSSRFFTIPSCVVIGFTRAQKTRLHTQLRKQEIISEKRHQGRKNRCEGRPSFFRNSALKYIMLMHAYVILFSTLINSITFVWITSIHTYLVLPSKLIDKVTFIYSILVHVYLILLGTSFNSISITISTS